MEKSGNSGGGSEGDQVAEAGSSLIDRLGGGGLVMEPGKTRRGVLKAD